MADELNNNTANNTENNEVRDNLRQAGDALLTAGSALGAAFSKAVKGLPERFKDASDSARETLNSATTEGEVRSVAQNFTNEAEKVFNQLRERDLKFTEDTKEALRSKVSEIRASFNKEMDQAEAGDITEDAQNVIGDLRTRFDDLVARLQNQFAGEQREGDIIEGEIVPDDITDTANNREN